jgi:hypothetical protein
MKAEIRNEQAKITRKKKEIVNIDLSKLSLRELFELQQALSSLAFEVNKFWNKKVSK